MSCQSGVCMDSQAKKFVAALTNPFAKEAIGAQVPDNYSFPTETRFVKTDLKILSNGFGNLDFSLLPSLFQSILTGTPGAFANPNSNNNFNINAISSDPEFQYTGNIAVTGASNGLWNLGGVTVPNQLSTQLSQYRIVGWGARVRALIAPINQAGRLVFSSTPSTSHSLFKPDIGGSQGVVGYEDVCKFFKLPQPETFSGFLTSEMLNVPDAMECMFSDLSLSGGMQWVSKATSAESLVFASTTNNDVSGNDSLGFGLTDKPDEVLAHVFPVDDVSTSPLLTANRASNILSGNDLINVGSNTDTFQVGVSVFSSVICQVASVGNTIGINYSRSGALASVPGFMIGYFGSYHGDMPLVGYAWRKVPWVLGNVVDLEPLASDGGPVGGYVTSVVLIQGALNSAYTSVAFTNPNSISFAINDVILFFPAGQLSTLPNYAIPLKSQFTQGSYNSQGNNVVNNQGYERYATSFQLRSTSQPVVETLSSAPETVDPGFIKSGGWSQMSCRGFGLPINSPCLSVELVYHIEGPPLITGENGGLVSGGQFPYVDKGLFDEALEYASRKPHFQLIPGGRSGSMLTNAALN